MGNESSTAKGWDRPSIDRVDRGLYIGGMAGAGRHSELRGLGVTHILCMAHYEDDRRAIERSSFSYLVVRAQDTATYDISIHFDDIHAFICQGRAAGGVYVHCMAGISRAATAVLVHLMRARRMPLAIAYRQLKTARPCVRPNPGFWCALEREASNLGGSEGGGASAQGAVTPSVRTDGELARGVRTSPQGYQPPSEYIRH